MAEQYKLPGSSYEEVIKIIKAYSSGKAGQPMSLEIVAQAAGMDKTIVSRNNGFLVQCGFISEGNQKAATELGIQLARAYNLKMENEVSRIWKECIEASEFLTRMLSAIKIRGTMEKSAFLNHIVYSSGATTTKHAKTGASTLIDLFELAGFITEQDGQISAIDFEADPPLDNSNSTVTNEGVSAPSSISVIPSVTKPNFTINININVSIDELDQLPDKIANLVEQVKGI